jgi:hypothetical protein
MNTFYFEIPFSFNVVRIYATILDVEYVYL